MLNIRVDLYHHLEPTDGVARKLDDILSLLTTVNAQGVQTMHELDTLTAKVAETTTVEQSAIELLNGLGAQIAAMKTDPAALQALADSLSAKSSDLAAAITANTPAA